MRLFPAPALGRPVVALLDHASIASAQTYTFFTLAGSPSSGTADGLGTAARFSDPNGLAFDGTNLWISDRHRAPEPPIVADRFQITRHDRGQC